MKFFSVLPWLQKSRPSLKGILLFGTHEGLISWRRQFLQKYYMGQGYRCVRAESAEEFFAHAHTEQSLFEVRGEKKCILYENVSDTLVSHKDFSSLFSTPNPHIILFSSSRVITRGKMVSFFQSFKEGGILPCYDRDEREMAQVLTWALKELFLSLEGAAERYLIDFLRGQEEEFFALLEILSLYGGDTSLTELDLKKVLAGFSSGRIEELNHYFFLGEGKELNGLLQQIEGGEWVSILRQLLQDTALLMAFHSYGLKPDSLKEFWGKKQLKFSYGRIPLYQKCLEAWPVECCGVALRELLRLEKGLKSSPSLSITELHHALHTLSLSFGCGTS